MPQYISTDPNAGSQAPKYLSQDPNAGQAPAPRPTSGAMSEEAWAALPTGAKVRNALQWGGKALAGMTGMGQAGAEAVDNPKATLALAAAGPAVKQIGSLIPRTARAAGNFEEVMQAAGDRPVNMEAPGQSALRIQELAERGGSMPKAARDLLKRVTDPQKPDATYREGRDFYSNISRLSADEYQRLTPVVRREVGNMRVALNQALSKTADEAGKLKEYEAAMSEYANAAKLKAIGQTVKDAATKYALPGGAVYYGLKKVEGLFKR